jgi:RHS repeat-associated protein
MLTRDDGTDVTTFVWDGWDLLSETTDSVTTDYLVPNGLIHSFLRDGDLYVVHVDALGSVRMVTDVDGAVVAQLEFSAWGEQLDGSVDSVPGGMPFKFVGALGVRFDSATGLHYMRQRWYSPTLQRFISRDPIGLRGGANVYSYAGNNPINAVDPAGTVYFVTTVGGNYNDDGSFTLGMGAAWGAIPLESYYYWPMLTVRCFCFDKCGNSKLIYYNTFRGGTKNGNRLFPGLVVLDFGGKGLLEQVPKEKSKDCEYIHCRATLDIRDNHGEHHIRQIRFDRHPEPPPPPIPRPDLGRPMPRPEPTPPAPRPGPIDPQRMEV